MLFDTVVFRELENVSLDTFGSKVFFANNLSTKEVTGSVSIIDDKGNLIASFYKTESYKTTCEISSTKKCLIRSLASMSGQFYLHFKNWI